MSIIPLNLYQTWHTKNLPEFMKKNIENTKVCNPEFNHVLYDDNDCREFLKKNFHPIILRAFDSLVPGAYKADLWRYCILYKNGGIYMDIKIVCSKEFKLINLTNKEYFVKDRSKCFDSTGGIYQALLICKPQNNRLLLCIKQIIRNIKNNYYGFSDLYPTGPGLMGKLFTKEEQNKLPFRNIDGEHIYYYNKPVFKKEYKEYRIEQQKFKKTESYNNIWQKRNIYTKI